MQPTSKVTVRKSDVVLFVPTLDGGVGRVTSLLARGMYDHGIAVEVWTTRDGEYASEIRSFAAVRNLSSRMTLLSVPEIFRLLRKERPAALISAYFHANCAAIIACWLVRTGTRVVITEHIALKSALASLSWGKRVLIKTLMRILYRYADVRVAVSSGVADEMAECIRMPREKISVIYNPVVSPELYMRSTETVSHPFFRGDEPVLIGAGRLMPEKDFPTLLEAFAQVNQTIPSRLIILGDGPDHEQLLGKVHALDISDRVSFPGRVTNPYPYFLQADLFVLSSVREGLPTVLIEAMALGTPIVSTDCPNGPSEILNGGAYGSLTPMRDPEALAQAMISVLRAPKQTVPDAALAPYTVTTATMTYMRAAQIV